MDEQLIALLETRLTTLEEITAHLFNGYVELATMTESIIAQMVKPLDEEAAKEFSTSMTAHRAEMLQMVKEVAGEMVTSNTQATQSMGPVAE